MEKEIVKNLLLLKEKQEKDTLEKDINKVLDLMERLSKSEGTIKEKYIIFRMAVGSFKCILLEEIRKNRIKKELKNVLNCKEEDIVYDENDIKENKNATIVASNIRYSATINEQYLENKKVIWGDLDIRALKDTSCLRNLELVGGNLLIGEGVFLPNLKYVFGKTQGYEEIKTYSK